jgi:hypothetical protein
MVPECGGTSRHHSSGDDRKAVGPLRKLKFDEWEMITKAYAFFLDGENSDVPDAAGGGFVGREIDNGVFFAIDKKVLSAVRAPTEAGRDLRNSRSSRELLS